MSSNIARGDILRADIDFFTWPLTAGIIRVRVLFEGGSYMRKYGSPRLEIKDYLERFPFSKFSKTFGLMVNS